MKCYCQLGILKLLEFLLPIFYPFSSAHTFNILLALLELRIFTLLASRIPENLTNGMVILPRKILLVISVIYKPQNKIQSWLRKCLRSGKFSSMHCIKFIIVY